MPMKVAKNQERAVEEAYRVAQLRREHRAKADDPRLIPGGPAGDQARVEPSREGTAG